MTTYAPSRPLGDPAFHDEYLRLVGDGDEYAATRMALDLLDDGVPAQRIMIDLIGGTQARVGELWAGNEWSVAREHAATAVNERVLAALAAQVHTRPHRGRITLACVDGEWHGLPARILAETLRMDGWRVDFLGASVPGPHLITHLHQTGPDAVALSCMIPTRLPRAHAAITACRAAGVPVIAGGRGFGPGGSWAQRLGADAWAGTAEEAVDRLADDWPPPPAPEFPAAQLGDEEYTHLVRSRPQLIEIAMQRLGAAYPAVHHYDAQQVDATREDFGHIADFLAASLYVGEPQIFRDFTAWTASVLTARDVSVTALRVGLRLVRDQLIDFPAAIRTLDLAIADLPRP
ncbi:cobalamin B12-binding domain-containing protein [Actinoplanes teichomyceticus]|uniref:Methanogenic corrinoid protein MtbC1 n=1 Tax=Actinoplanes teichomyceticus TaxID=1867 RepID=A0A561W9U9_ACTTI|nr:cobalamin-dependent protein [Actinoplanes teichomyceticus]TWG20619.1 methanogenic corrinoid protein MtbC1 [Actinoplanes teichomyceticus]GIF15954.1 cobalamin-binding protein [Actinoplanes teichomyceticus]